jgi:hypothetical protein
LTDRSHVIRIFLSQKGKKSAKNGGGYQGLGFIKRPILKGFVGCE